MTAIRVLLQSARLPIFQPTPATAIDLRAWIATRNYFVDSDLRQGDFTLRASDPAQVQSALANDLNRMASAAFESAAGVATDTAIPRSLAWGSIRTYYAAFFAAHAFMRLYGTACSQIDSEHADAVFNSATVFGKTGGLSALDSGFYLIEVDPTFTKLKFRKLKESHRDTWATFLSVLHAVDTTIPTAAALSTHKVEASGLLTELRDGITRSSSARGNWLSVMRNSINYRLSHGVWFPHSAKAARVDLIESVGRSWLVSPTTGATAALGNDLEWFFGTSVLAVALLRELLTTACELTSPLSPIMRNGCMRLLHDAKATRTQREASAT